MKPIYLDYNATTPIDPRVADAMLPFLREHFGNPSSSHWYGVQTKKAVEKARRQLAELLGCATDEIVFTSGGSESNNTAIKGVAWARRNQGRHIITTAIEHPAVLEVCRYLEKRGYRLTVLPVDDTGLVDLDALKEVIDRETILVSVMHANNEVGTVQPIREIAEIVHAYGALLHVDAAQSVGKIRVRVDELGVDLLSVAGHKFYAPKGVGALFLRRGVELEKLIHGASHEMNRRAGTENVLEIVGLGKAAELVAEELESEAPRLKRLRDRLWQSLRAELDDIRLNGHPQDRLPNTLSISFRGLEANTILSELETVAASAGAACHAEEVSVSHVLEAMRVPIEYAMGTIRFSVGRMTTEDEVDRAAQAVVETVKRLQPRENRVFVAVGAPDVKLTHFTHGLGCACKLRPQVLEEVLARMPTTTDPRVLVGVETADDAAVYKLDEHTALVQTVDFFTPVVDDPYQFGAIAAANSLSDIYAMGGRPLFALNVVGFPSNRLPTAVLERILEGAREKAAEAGVAIIGGHTVDDSEPKFGLAVTGVVAPDRILTNRGARVGDALVLTKKIGTGILATALKRGMLEPQLVEVLVVTMATLNRAAADVARSFEIHACTDVTGFGLLGHLLEMTRASGVNAKVTAVSVPLLPGVQQLAAAGVVPGGSKANREYVAPWVQFGTGVGEVLETLLCDAQTSGGLLFALPKDQAEDFVKALQSEGVAGAARIGEVVAEGPGRLHVV